jgi:magnesium chelatase family protein
VRTAIKAAQLSWPGRCTVNLAPAELKKEGSGFDLPIALALLAASGQIPHERLAEHVSCGELALDGRLRRVGGVLGVAEGARRAGIERIICAFDACPEAALAGVEPIGVRTSRRRSPISAASATRRVRRGNGASRPPPLDLVDVRGQERARRALELAAAGATTCCSAGRRDRQDDARAAAARILPPLEERRRSRSRASTRSRASSIPSTR